MKYLLFCLPMLLVLTGCSGGNQNPAAPGAGGNSGNGSDVIGQERIPLESDNGGVASTRRNFYFVIDGSGSMGERPSAQGSKTFSTKMEGAKWAVDQFLNTVPDDCNLGLYVFDWNGETERVPLGPNNREKFRKAVQEISESGGTPLYDGMVMGVDKLVEQYKKQLGYGEYRLVVVTDGQASYIPDAAEYASKYGIPIYSIGISVDQSHPLREYSVSFKDAQSAEDLAQSLKEVLAETEDFSSTEFEEEE